MRETVDLILHTLLLRTPSLPTWAPDSGCKVGLLSLSTPCFLSVIKGNPLTFYVEQLISCSALISVVLNPGQAIPLLALPDP